MTGRSLLSRFLVGLTLLSRVAVACEPCALYSATEMQGLSDSAWRVSLYEQYTSYKESPSYVDNSIKDGELINSYSVTQFSIGYDISERWGTQFTLPIVHREFDKFEGFRRSSDSDTGVGDVSLAGFYSVVADRTGSSADVWNLYAGIKFPTGDTGSLESSVEAEEHSEDLSAQGAKHHPINTGGTGSIVTIGTGSYDFPVGTSLFIQRERMFLLTSAQYTIRTEGDFDYQFDNDLLFDLGPGIFLQADDDYSIALRAAFAGEFKGRDQFEGESVYGSEVKNWFLGPEIIATSSNNFSGEVGMDFVLDTDDTSPTTVTDYRIRAAINYRF